MTLQILLSIFLDIYPHRSPRGVKLSVSPAFLYFWQFCRGCWKDPSEGNEAPCNKTVSTTLVSQESPRQCQWHLNISRLNSSEQSWGLLYVITWRPWRHHFLVCSLTFGHKNCNCEVHGNRDTPGSARPGPAGSLYAGFQSVPTPLMMMTNLTIAFAGIRCKSQREDTGLLAVSSISLECPLWAMLGETLVYIPVANIRCKNKQNFDHLGKPE